MTLAGRAMMLARRQQRVSQRERAVPVPILTATNPGNWGRPGHLSELSQETRELDLAKGPSSLPPRVPKIVGTNSPALQRRARALDPNPEPRTEGSRFRCVAGFWFEHDPRGFWVRVEHRGNRVRSRSGKWVDPCAV